jgi:hypothetical protein
MSSIVISGDTSGTVTLQAPAVAGSTVITLPSTSMTLGAGSLNNIQYFTASGTYTPTSGTSFIVVQVVGGGCGGGRSSSLGGAGGTSSFGAFCSATGGGSTTTVGTGTGGDLNISGTQSITSPNSSAIHCVGGLTARGTIGAGGVGTPVSKGAGGAGGAGGGFSQEKITSGFSGTTVTVGAGGTPGTGGDAGASGIVIIYEYK